MAVSQVAVSLLHAVQGCEVLLWARLGSGAFQLLSVRCTRICFEVQGCALFDSVRFSWCCPAQQNSGLSAHPYTTTTSLWIEVRHVMPPSVLTERLTERSSPASSSWLHALLALATLMFVRAGDLCVV